MKSKIHEIKKNRIKLSKKLLLSIFLLNFALSYCQSNEIIVPKNTNLPQDSIVSNQLLKSLNGFLSQKEKPNKENSFVLKGDLLEMSILMDEMKGIEKSGKYKDDNFYKCYLQNVIELDKTNFLIQFSYIGLAENTPVYTASFEFLGKQKDNQFYFYSPLKRNTISWQNKKIGDCVFHFKSTINTKKAKEYSNNVAFFDKKLNNPSFKTELYCFSDFTDVLKNIGVLYKSDYNGMVLNELTAKESNSFLIANGSSNSNFDSFDPHDLWHERLYIQYSRKITNKPIDEACAYLYGGSWGMSWQGILEKFKKKVSNNKQTNWLELYGKFENFSENDETHLMAEYVINALIVEKIEKEKGFTGVLEFLKCGKYNKENNNYFEILEKLTGIKRSNFNEKVWELIEIK